MRKVFLFTLLLVLSLSALDVGWSRLYPEIDSPVYDTSGCRGLYENMFLALAEDVDGLAYYDEMNDSLIGVYDYLSLGVVSAQINESNTDEVFCAIGSGSYSDGLYKFNIGSLQFERIEFAINPNFIKKLNSGYYFGCSEGLVYSSDGITWTDIDYFDYKSVTGVAEDNDGNIIICAGTELFINDGSSFTSFDTGLTVRDIKFDGSFMVSLSDGTYSDGIYGVWYETGKITDVLVYEYVFNSDKMCFYGYWFAVTHIGSDQMSLLGDENGIDTSPVSGNFNEIYFIEPDYSSYWSFIIGTDKGVYKGMYPMGIEDTSIPSSTELHQNYPNPFNPVTEISYSLKSEGQVTLSVFNTKGELVSSLVNGMKTAGNHSVNFNGEGLNSGIYFYRLSVNDKVVASKKMMMLK